MLKKTEMMILSELRNNSRESLTRMSRKTSIPISTIYEKMKRYEGDIIKKYTMIIDFAKLGFNTKATILVRVPKEYRDNLKDYLIHNKFVNNLDKINNGYDFIIDGVFRELKDVECFLEKLENEFNVTDKYVYYVIDELKKEGFMSSPDYVKISGDFI